MNIVQFPGLGGLEFSINPVAIPIGQNGIYWYGIIIAIAFTTAILLAAKDSEKYGIKQDDMIDVVMYAAPAGIIGARLYYVIFSWSNYRDDWTEIFKIWHGGLAIYGGIIFGVLAAYFFAKARKINPIKLLDFAIPYVALAQAIGRWGNFINQEAFGTNTNLPWGMTSETIKNTLLMLQTQGKDVNPDIPVHPTFLYESLWNILAFFILMWFRKKKKVTGEVVCVYIVLYGVGRVFIEGLRTDSLMLGNLRVSQIMAGLSILVFGIILVNLRKKAFYKKEEIELGNSEYGNILSELKEDEENHTAESADEDIVEENKNK